MNLDNKMSVKWDIESWIFKAQLMKLKTVEFSNTKELTLVHALCNRGKKIIFFSRPIKFLRHS